MGFASLKSGFDPPSVHQEPRFTVFTLLKQRPCNERPGGTLGIDLTVPLTWDTENYLG